MLFSNFPNFFCICGNYLFALAFLCIKCYYLENRNGICLPHDEDFYEKKRNLRDIIRDMPCGFRRAYRNT